MPSYGATDVIAVIILAVVALPWSHKAWQFIVYIAKKATRWAFAYTIAVTVVAAMQYSTTYTSMKIYGDAALNDVLYKTFRRILSSTLGALFGGNNDEEAAGDDIPNDHSTWRDTEL